MNLQCWWLSYVTSLSGEITVRKTTLKSVPVTICRSFKKEQHLVACIVSTSNRVRITSSKRCFWQQRTRYRYAEVHVLPSYLPISPLFRSKEIYVFLLICLCLMSVLFVVVQIPIFGVRHAIYVMITTVDAYKRVDVYSCNSSKILITCFYTTMARKQLNMCVPNALKILQNLTTTWLIITLIS